MNAKLKLSCLDGPRYSKPINGAPGLYINVLASEPCSAADLLAFVRRAVCKAGYNPDGRADLGPPCCYGVLSRTYAMRFYEKAEGR